MNVYASVLHAHRSNLHFVVERHNRLTFLCWDGISNGFRQISLSPEDAKEYAVCSRCYQRAFNEARSKEKKPHWTWEKTPVVLHEFDYGSREKLRRAKRVGSFAKKHAIDIAKLLLWNHGH